MGRGPTDDNSVQNAVKAIEWAVKGILREYFPMLDCESDRGYWDFKQYSKKAFKNSEVPPQINAPTGVKTIAVLEEYEDR